LSIRLFLLPQDSISHAQQSWEGEASYNWGRPQVLDRLNHEPGNHLVLVAYDVKQDPNYMEWVFNSADLASQKVIWAHTLEPEESDNGLKCLFKDRHIWLVSVRFSGGSDDEQYSLQPLPSRACTSIVGM
jgi:hypothetical protein